MEPSRSHVSHRRSEPAQALSRGAAAAAAVLALTSTGDTVLLAGLLAAAGGGGLGLFAGLAAAGAVLLRWGVTSLDAVSGAQAVLGPAVAVGPALGAAAAGLAAAAIVLVPAARRAGLPFTVASGVAAATVAWGPGLASVTDAVSHLAIAGVGAGLAVAGVRWLPSGWARPLVVALGLGAVAMGALA